MSWPERFPAEPWHFVWAFICAFNLEILLFILCCTAQQEGISRNFIINRIVARDPGSKKSMNFWISLHPLSIVFAILQNDHSQGFLGRRLLLVISYCTKWFVTHFIGQWHDHIDTRLKLTCEYNEFFFFLHKLSLLKQVFRVSRFVGYSWKLVGMFVRY